MSNSRLSGAPNPRAPRVILAGDGHNAAARQRLLGVLQHAHAEGWQLLSTAIHQLSAVWDLDGVIGEFLSEENTSDLGFDLSNLGVPYVPFEQPVPFEPSDDPAVPPVTIDYLAVGDLAARHLRATGFQHYAFLGKASDRASQLQLTGFVRPLQRAELPCTPLLLQQSELVAQGRTDLSTRIASWVQGLPRQTAVYCVSDDLAVRVSLACQTQKRSIPNDVAVLGMGNDEWLCAFPTVALSSIALPDRALGFKAAVMLSRLMRGESAPSRQELLPPTEVIERNSTLAFADAHPAAQRAVRFMREHAYRGISVQDVIDHARLSRRSLENHVRAMLGHAPHQELMRLRVDRATHLLDTSTLPLQEIARTCGFSDGRQMSETFRRHLALTPSQYRRQRRAARLKAGGRRDSERPPR